MVLSAMDYRYRQLSKKILRYMDYFPSVVLTGARQVGKSTLLRNLLKESHEIITFDPVIDIQNARSEPEMFFKNHPGPLILDEIQYAPELVPVVKRLIDKDKVPGKFILSGSQQWGILNTITESLAGRTAIIDLAGFNLTECAQREELKHSETWLDNLLLTIKHSITDNAIVHLPFPLNEHIYRGQLPEAQEIPLDIVPAYFSSYLTTYIERDIRIMADVSDLQQFGRFYKLCGALSSQEINFSQLGRDIGLTPQTAKRWLDLLKATFQWIEIPAFSGNTLKRISGKAKGYLSDTGLLCNCLFLSGPQAVTAHPSWGSIFETLVVTEVLKRISTMESRPAVYHWRSHSGAEVDLILEQNGKFFPIEVKSTARPSKKDTRGISAFRETYSRLDIAEGTVIYPGDGGLQLSEKDFAVSYFMV